MKIEKELIAAEKELQQARKLRDTLRTLAIMKTEIKALRST